MTRLLILEIINSTMEAIAVLVTLHKSLLVKVKENLYTESKQQDSSHFFVVIIIGFKASVIQ